MRSHTLPAIVVAGFLPFISGELLCAADQCKLGSEALERRDLQQAEGLLKQCMAAYPAQLLPYIQLCALYQLQGKPDELHRVASAGLKKFPEEKRFYLTVGTQAGREKRYERALEVFSEGFRRWPDDQRFRDNLASSHLGIGMKFLDQGKNREAEKHLRQATELAKDDLEAHLNLGRALQNLNQSLEALAEFDRVLELDPRLSLAHFHRGLVRHGLAEYDRAIEDFGREIEITPDYPPSYLFRGLARIARGEWAGALPDLELAAARMPENAKAQYGRARCLNQLGRKSEAEAGFRKTIELDPSDPGPLNALGRLLVETGRSEEAEPLFQQGARLEKERRSAAPGEIQFESSRPRRPQ
jgi:tetratricopeptide (TPR) repeat protein